MDEKNFDLLAWADSEERIRRLVSWGIFGGGAAVSFGATTALLLFMGAHPQDDPTPVWVAAPVLFCVFWLVSCFITAAVMERVGRETLERRWHGGVLPAQTRGPLFRLARELEAALALDPPTAVVDELLALRLGAERVAVELMATPVELQSRERVEPAYRGLAEAASTTSLLRQDLEEARFVSLVTPPPLKPVLKSREAIQQETAAREAALARASDFTAILPPESPR